MKAAISFIAFAMVVGNLANAAIKIKCQIESNGEMGYSSRSVEKSLPANQVTGIASIGEVMTQEITVEVGAGADGQPFVSGICTESATFGPSICSEAKSALVLKVIDQTDKISCSAQ